MDIAPLGFCRLDLHRQNQERINECRPSLTDRHAQVSNGTGWLFKTVFSAEENDIYPLTYPLTATLNVSVLDPHTPLPPLTSI